MQRHCLDRRDHILPKRRTAAGIKEPKFLNCVVVGQI